MSEQNDVPIPRLCHNCDFFDEPIGECHRFAPRPKERTKTEWNAINEDNAAAFWPSVDRTNWCGDYAEAREIPRDGWEYHYEY